MANIVTNRIFLSGPSESLDRLLARILHAPIRMDALPAAPDMLSLEFAPHRLVPQPTVLEGTGRPEALLGLAVISKGGASFAGGLPLHAFRSDLVAARCAEENRMSRGAFPPETADTVLRRHGLEGLSGRALAFGAERVSPGCLAAAQAELVALEKTGYHDWHDWRIAHWGVRAFGGEAHLRREPDGALSIRFDSVNSCPLPWIDALAKAEPALDLHGASVEEDNDYAVFFATEREGPDGLRLLHHEQGDRDGVARACEIIWNRPPFDDDMEEEPFDP